MADVNFIETDPQTIYETVMSNLMEYCREALYPGDERRIFGEALTAVLVGIYNDFNDKAQQRMLQYARGTVLDAIGERYSVKRAAAEHATATFRFTASAAQPNNIIIPIGTRITNDGSVYFATTAAAVLQAGDTTIDVPARCQVGGAAYNGYTAGQIDTLVDVIPYMIASNTTITSGGDDGEPYDESGDNRFRDRIRLAPSSFSAAGSLSSYRYHALSADAEIIDVAVISDAACEVDVYPLMQGGELPDAATLAKVTEALGSGVRPLTDNVTVSAPTLVDYTINIKYYCEKSQEAAVIQAVEGDDGAVKKFIEWQRSALGRNVNPDKLRSFVLAAGATRVDVTAPTHATLDQNEAAHLSGIPTITHTTE